MWEGPAPHFLPVPWAGRPPLWASVSPSAVMAQLTGVLAGRRVRACPWLSGILQGGAAPAGLGLPSLPPSPPSAFWKVHLPPTQPRCPGDTVTVVTVKGGPVDEHKRGLAQATHRLCKVLGGEGQGWGHLGGKRSGPPPQGPSWRRHHCGGCRDRGCMGSRGS